MRPPPPPWSPASPTLPSSATQVEVGSQPGGTSSAMLEGDDHGALLPADTEDLASSSFPSSHFATPLDIGLSASSPFSPSSTADGDALMIHHDDDPDPATSQPSPQPETTGPVSQASDDHELGHDQEMADATDAMNDAVSSGVVDTAVEPTPSMTLQHDGSATLMVHATTPFQTHITHTSTQPLNLNLAASSAGNDSDVDLSAAQVPNLQQGMLLQQSFQGVSTQDSATASTPAVEAAAPPIPPLSHQQWDQILNDDNLDWAGFQTVFNGANHVTLAPENMGLVDFLGSWARTANAWRMRSMPRDVRSAPSIERVRSQARNFKKSRIEYEDLEGQRCDFQGIDWDDIGVSRSMARCQRKATYRNYVNKPGSDGFHHDTTASEPVNSENYFRFRRMEFRRDIRLLHFQLRNIVACASRTRVFYPSSNSIRELDPTTSRTRRALAFDPDVGVQVSTMSATENVLVAGDFAGCYHYRSLDHQDETPRSHSEGRLTDNVSGITNHVQVYSGRHSGGPLAAFASNDYSFRVVDLTTNTLVSENRYDCPMNCSAISPDRRLRVMVGDSLKVAVVDAESGEVLQDLPGHRDFGFACDWADDGWTIATGFQDKTVRIWDARMWRKPVSIVRSDMSGARSLHFSPLGSGKRLLLAAEEADFINVIDAQTFEKQQRLDVFGEIGGVSFTNQGQNLMALVCDPERGGLIQFDRCDAGAETTHDYTELDYREKRALQIPFWQSSAYDWAQTPKESFEGSRSSETPLQRRRKAGLARNLEPF